MFSFFHRTFDTTDCLNILLLIRKTINQVSLLFIFVQFLKKPRILHLMCLISKIKWLKFFPKKRGKAGVEYENLLCAGYA